MHGVGGWAVAERSKALEQWCVVPEQADPDGDPDHLSKPRRTRLRLRHQNGQSIDADAIVTTIQMQTDW